MTEYYNINFNNDETDKLDKLAREINNKKTSLCKKVTEDFNKQESQWKNGIDNVINSQKFSYLPMNKNYNKNINDKHSNDKISSYSLSSLSSLSDGDNTNYSEYSDLNSSKLSFDTSNTNKSSRSNFSDFQTKDNKVFLKDNKVFLKDNKVFSNKKNTSSFSDISSIDSFGSLSSMDSFIDSESIDTYLKNPNAKKNVKFNKIVQSIDYDDCSKNDDNILEHMKKCNNCKQKLLRFINGIGECSVINNDNNLNNNLNNVNNFNTNNTDNKNNKSLFGNIKTSSMNSKELVIMLMIGIFIIIMLDLLLRNKN